MSWKRKGGILVAAIVVCVLLFSPFKKEDDMYVLESSIVVDAPVSKVYTYLGNSANASHWSVFVDHITPLNPSKVADGKKGSIRRCFKNADEQGIWWDEEILTDIQNEERELTIYNLHGFAVQTYNLTTKQLYTANGDKQTELTFGLYKNAEEVTVLDWLKMKTTGWYIGKVFKKNLKGIKRELEK